MPALPELPDIEVFRKDARRWLDSRGPMLVKTGTTQGPRRARCYRNDEYERANGNADRGADFVRKHGQNRHGFPPRLGRPSRQD